MSNQMKVYIASPFFNSEEIDRVKKMEKFLGERGYCVYSPMRDGIVLTPDATAEDRLNTYKENVQHVMEADLVMVIVATKDTGTSVELGMKVGQWETNRATLEQLKHDDPDILNEYDKIILNQKTPRMISFADNGTNLNVMLLGAVLKHCRSWEELSNYMDYVDKVGIENADRDEESITSTKVY